MKTCSVALAAGAIVLGAASVRAQDGSITFPFVTWRNLVLVPVDIAGETFHLILDTGMPMEGVVLFSGPRVDSLGLGNPPDAPEDAIQVTAGLSGVELSDQPLYVIPSPLGGPSRSSQGEGIIGKAVFDRFAVRIDHDRQVVTLTEPDRFVAPSGGHPVPFELDAFGIPQLVCKVELQDGATLDALVLVDTGAGHALSLQVSPEAGVRVPERAVEYRLGKTVYGEVVGHVGRIRRLEIGGFALTDVVTSFPSAPVCAAEEGKQGNLGGDALRRFNVTLDYAGRRLFLEPGTHFRDPFEFNMSGLGLEPSEAGGLRIERVVPDSPASEAGLEVDDRILAVDGRPAEEYGFDTLRRMLEEEGRQLALRVSRDGEERDVRVTLRRLI